MAEQERSKGLLWTVLAVAGVLLIGGAVGGLLVYAPQEPERVERDVVGPLVETVQVRREDVAVVVRGQGTVEAREQAELVPQVSGRVAAVHEELAAGGFIEAGQTLVQIEREDFELALRQARTELEQAQAAEETAEAEIAEAQATLADARRELERAEELVARDAANQREQEQAQLAVDVAEAGLRRAQSSLSTAGAQVSAAEVAIEQAETDLERTQMTLPFDAVITEEQVSVGQFVTAGQSIGGAYGTQAVEITVPLEDREVGWLATLPVQVGAGNGEAGEPLGIRADIQGDLFGRDHGWQGRVVRTEGQLDRRSRMVGVVVRVEEPFEGVPLLPGAFVEVAMSGRQLEDVIAVPRYAVHGQDSEVWVVEDGRLRVRPVEVVRRERERVWVGDGLEDGARVVVSPIDAVTDGMRVRTTPGEPAEQAADDAAAEEDADAQR